VAHFIAGGLSRPGGFRVASVAAGRLNAPVRTALAFLLLLGACAHRPRTPQEEDREAVHPLMPRLMACNSEPHSGDANFVVHFTVAPDGSVSDVAVAPSEGIENIAACVRRVIATASYSPRAAPEQHALPLRF
jgi:hypothetical protein